ARTTCIAMLVLCMPRFSEPCGSRGAARVCLKNLPTRPRSEEMTYPPQAGQPTNGPQQPPASDPLTEFGVKPNPARPAKVNWLTQALWGYLAVSVLMLLFSIIAVATAPWWLSTGFIVVSGIVGLVFHSLSAVIAWFVSKEKLGMFGAS